MENDNPESRVFQPVEPLTLITPNDYYTFHALQFLSNMPLDSTLTWEKELQHDLLDQKYTQEPTKNLATRFLAVAIFLGGRGTAF